MANSLYLDISKIVKKINDSKIPLEKKGDTQKVLTKTGKLKKEYVEYEDDKVLLGDFLPLLGGWRLKWRLTAYGEMDWKNKNPKILYLVDRFILSIRDDMFLIGKNVVKVWGFDWIEKEDKKTVFDVFLTVLPDFSKIQDPE